LAIHPPLVEVGGILARLDKKKCNKCGSTRAKLKPQTDLIGNIKPNIFICVKYWQGCRDRMNNKELKLNMKRTLIKYQWIEKQQTETLEILEKLKELAFGGAETGKTLLVILLTRHLMGARTPEAFNLLEANKALTLRTLGLRKYCSIGKKQYYYLDVELIPNNEKTKIDPTKYKQNRDKDGSNIISIPVSWEDLRLYDKRYELAKQRGLFKPAGEKIAEEEAKLKKQLEEGKITSDDYKEEMNRLSENKRKLAEATAKTYPDPAEGAKEKPVKIPPLKKNKNHKNSAEEEEGE
ncbi:46069_t:CDS:2, partial [Gigaspora margarita]